MKVVMVTLGFAPARILLTCIDQVYRTIGISPKHYLLNNHYPVNKEINDYLVLSICKAYGINYYTLGKNVGLQKGYNFLIETAQLEDDDLIIGVDPDTYPITPGWGKALLKVMEDDRIGWATLQNEASERELVERGHDKETINGVNVLIAHAPCVNSVCCWKWKILKQMGGLQEPREWYGGIECMMWGMLEKLGKRWAYLQDFKEERNDLVKSETVYTEYKWEYAHKGSTKLDFESWLKEKNIK
jgi:hypothetical protein